MESSDLEKGRPERLTQDQKVLPVTVLTHPMSRWRCPLRTTESARFQKITMNHGLKEVNPMAVVHDWVQELQNFSWILGRVRFLHLRWLQHPHLGRGANPQWRCWRFDDGDSKPPCGWPRGAWLLNQEGLS